jgi:16S rRNA (uracil1498-N3)-methyltransferase
VLRLAPEEAHYVARVCRARAGDIAEATDGRGALARLRLTSVGAAVSAEVVAVDRIERKQRAWLWCGAPERGRADWMVEKLAELGVERFQPLECEGASWPAGAARIERWRRLAVAALRQSRGAFLLEIRDPVTVDEAIATMVRPALCRVGDPAGRPAGAGAPPGGPAARGDALEIGAIGPSGGFGAADRARLEVAGFVPTRLADARLRTETAAVCLAAWWAAGAG